MKAPDKNDPSQRLVRYALTNIFFFPGLGSVRAGRRRAGAGQIIIVLTGSIMVFVWVYKILDEYYSLMFGDVKVESVGWIGVVGGILVVLAWMWSVVTSIGIFSEASKAAAIPPPTPPVLPATPAAIAADSRFAKEMAALPQWRKNGQVISRTYEFPDFPAAMVFVNAVAQAAEQAQHHPDVDIRWNKVTLALTTHDVGGLTAKDFAMARQCDLLSVRN